MEKALKVIDRLQQEGVIEGYALGGATALLFYTEPSLTFDVDVFVFLPRHSDSSVLINLDPLYKALKAKGYSADKEHVIVEGIPVQFIPVYNSLIEEAVREATQKKYGILMTKVVRLEYLLAIMVDTNRPKDRERLKNFVEAVKFGNWPVTKFDKKLLSEILNRHSLWTRWEKIIAK